MTREEARQIMSTWLVSSKGTKGQRGYIEGWFDEEDAEAFRMAIEALSAEADCSTCKHKDKGWDSAECDSCCGNNSHYEPSADAVKVAYICDGRACNCDCTLEECTHTKDIEHAKNFIRMGDVYMESADAVQGEWIWRTDIPVGDGRTSAGYICSNCGKDYWHGNVFKYCPSCGSRMKGCDSDAEQGGDAKMDNCQAQAPQNYMQQSRQADMLLVDLNSKDGYLLDGKYKVNGCEDLTDGRVEVVRCKDCRYYNPKDENKPYPCGYGLYMCNKDDFCSYGERSEE